MSFTTASGKDCVVDWCADLDKLLTKKTDDSVTGVLDGVLSFLAEREQSEWGRPEFAPMGGGIFEIRFTVNKVE